MANPKKLSTTPTSIPGLLVVDIPVFEDERGFFKENWQREKMLAVGLPDFQPVQHNISYNNKRGVTRGMHAEPWDKLVSIGKGSTFACIVDLRAGEAFGQTFTITLDPSTALFVPAGCANSFQVLEDETMYSYLVNQHWQKDLEYKQFNIKDTQASWPIPLAQAILSEKDLNSPAFTTLTPYPLKKICVLGSGGQLGRVLQTLLTKEEADFFTSSELDITDLEALQKINWQNYNTIINCAAYTKVDLAEVEIAKSYAVNVIAVENLAKIADKHKLTLVHVSSDYVFDGTKDGEYSETDTPNPKSIYGLHKLLGEKHVEVLQKHYIVRTSWVIGEGLNFVSKMLELGSKGINPSVVSDQVGRPTLATDLAKFILHLLSQKSAYGTYNFSNSGEPTSFADLARFVFEAKEMPTVVTDTTTKNFFKDKVNYATRPLNSRFDLTKAESTGFKISDWKESLRAFLQ